MPSNLFEVRLEADPALLRIVSGSGVLALPLGVLVVTMIGVTAIMQLVLALVWVGLILRELACFSRSVLCVRFVVLNSSGCAYLIDPQRRTLPVRLLSGTVILRHFAWFRLADAKGKAYYGILLAARCDVDSWHRLQLLWQQSRTDFGHPAGA